MRVKYLVLSLRGVRRKSLRTNCAPLFGATRVRRKKRSGRASPQESPRLALPYSTISSFLALGLRRRLEYWLMLFGGFEPVAFWRESFAGDLRELGVLVDADVVARELLARDGGRADAHEGIEDEVA